MIEKISLVLINESGDVVPVAKTSDTKIEIKIEEQIADIFSQICFRNNSIADAEIKIAEKFYFALNLKNYLEEIKKNDDRTNAELQN